MNFIIIPKVVQSVGSKKNVYDIIASFRIIKI